MKSKEELILELMQLAIDIGMLIERVRKYGPSRPMSIVITKLEEAELWITKEVMPLTETAQGQG
jgi:squalene cyclase